MKLYCLPAKTPIAATDCGERDHDDEPAVHAAMSSIIRRRAAREQEMTREAKSAALRQRHGLDSTTNE